MATVVLLAGCSADPRGMLDATARAYRQATSYSDDARVRITVTRGDAQTEETIPFRVAFSRPDKLRIDCYDARIVADGTTLFAAVGNVPAQVLAEPVKSPLAMDQLFADEQVRATLAEGDAGCPTQLPLLLADDTVDLILADASAPPRVAGTETVDGRACTRIDIPKPDGLLSLWIDRANHLVRRLSLPTDAYAAMLSQQSGAVTGVAVVVDFLGATVNEPIAGEAFSFAVPDGAVRVATLEPPPRPQPPSGLVGKPAPPFTLTGLDGKSVSREGLADSIVVLEFFFNECRPCAKTMPQIAKAVAAARAAGTDVKHFAVSVDEADVADAILQTKVTESGGSGTILRDPRGVAAEAFEVSVVPALVVIATDGTVADVVLGDHNRLGDDLGAILTAATAGKATLPLVRDRFESRLREYRGLLDKVAGGDRVERMPEQTIAPRKQPVRFKLAAAWRSDAVGMPGNLLVVDDQAASPAAPAAERRPSPRIMCLDGWRTVVILDTAGKERSRHELGLPKTAAVGFLRTALDAGGRRWWLGAAKGGQHVFLFDDTWQLRTTYPPLDAPSHAGITDAQLLDTTGDGTPEIVVSYLGTVGVQCADLDGKRLWRDRSAQGIVSLAAQAPATNRGVVGVDGAGRFVAIAADGKAAAPISLAGSAAAAAPLLLRHVFAGPVATDGAWAFAGLAGASLGSNTAVGLTATGATEWTIQLADGMHRDGPIEPVAWADLLGTSRRQWLIAAPDGSVTVAWADGGVVDRYCHGRPLVGIGGYRASDAGHVVLATPEGIESLRVEDVALD